MKKSAIIINGMILMFACCAVTVIAADRVPTPEEFKEQVRRYNDSGGTIGNLRNRPIPPQISKAAEQFNKAVSIHNNKKATSGELKEAASLYQAASDAGIPQASTNLAMLYIEGKGVKKDVKKAVALLEVASKKDVSEADLALGSLYINGKEVKKDEKKGEWHLNKAAKAKNPNAVKMLADYKEWKKNYEQVMQQLQANMKKNQSFPTNIQLPQGVPVQAKPQTVLPFPPVNSAGTSQIPGVFLPTMDQIISPSMKPRPIINPVVNQPAFP
jgi:hypothetical protein